MTSRVPARIAACCALLLTPALPAPVLAAQATWFRGNTHAHTINSDGNAAADVVVRWYREHGYQFIVVTDHEFLTQAAPLQAQFGAEGRFLVMPGEEIGQMVPDAGGTRTAHVCAINIQKATFGVGEDRGMLGRIAPQGTTIGAALGGIVTAVRTAGGVAQVNHPNFLYSLRREDLAGLPDGTLLEVWNAHPLVNNLGGSGEEGGESPSTERLWDDLLDGGKRIFGVASDDSHEYYDFQNRDGGTPGNGWIWVRADRLTPDAIAAALQRGDFYASTGVTLEDYRAGAAEIAIDILSGKIVRGRLNRLDARYVTRFIGRGGRVLAEVPGTHPRYAIRGDEGRVRAVITDSNGHKAWTQPEFVQ
jgi:hypothetical protein